MNDFELNRVLSMIVQAYQAGVLTQERAREECLKAVREWEATNKKNERN